VYWGFSIAEAVQSAEAAAVADIVEVKMIMTRMAADSFITRYASVLPFDTPSPEFTS
jgi:hypothetical protein